MNCTTSSIQVAVILPAFNEASTISDVITTFSGKLPNAYVVVVDNNSTDGTASIASDTLHNLDTRGRIISEPRQGKGFAVRKAFQEVEADIYILSDADCTYPAEEVHKLIEPILTGTADMTVGDRHSTGSYQAVNNRIFHRFGNRLVRWMINTLYSTRLSDIMSGYRAFSRQFVKTYPILVDGFELETDMTLHSLHRRFRITEIPITYRNRPSGSISKLSTFSDGARVIFAITQILRYYRPLLFFSMMSFVFFVAGILASIPVFSDWFTIRYIEHVPMAILASALEVIAVLTLAIGFVLDSVVRNEKMAYELSLLNNKNIE